MIYFNPKVSAVITKEQNPTMTIEAIKIDFILFSLLVLSVIYYSIQLR